MFLVSPTKQDPYATRLARKAIKHGYLSGKLTPSEARLLDPNRRDRHEIWRLPTYQAHTSRTHTHAHTRAHRSPASTRHPTSPHLPPPNCLPRSYGWVEGHDGVHDRHQGRHMADPILRSEAKCHAVLLRERTIGAAHGMHRCDHAAPHCTTDHGAHHTNARCAPRFASHRAAPRRTASYRVAPRRTAPRTAHLHTHLLRIVPTIRPRLPR